MTQSGNVAMSGSLGRNHHNDQTQVKLAVTYSRYGAETQDDTGSEPMPMKIVPTLTLIGIGLSPIPAHAQELNYRNAPHAPIEIEVRQVKITPRDVEQAALHCLVKEGKLQAKGSLTEGPTPAQTIVMATVCP